MGKEQEILAWAKANIGEKAAIPKEIIILPQIPLTPVGKIFKPALRWDATKRVYLKELKALGDIAESFHVDVGEHKLFGTLANIKIKPAKKIEPELIIKSEIRISKFESDYKTNNEMAAKRRKKHKNKI